ncbi:MAG: anthranilate phosphoribosyltransferase [Candidatus Omnitrophota bacterium]|jgi:anthranilate phosphoribosyltransferase|nr:MAG: anthranilate phosphoribosyltransferase [Candidatus Omnitrophota bacterium]
MIQEAITLLKEKKDLNPEQMYSAMEEIMAGKAVTEDIVRFLLALEDKGYAVEELTSAARVMRKFAVKISPKEKEILDTCGTGGDQKGTFNVSTAVAFVASGCGVTVAKHGNRSVSSCCGSADILESLGVNIEMSVEKIEACLDDIGIAFLFAQRMHPAMKNAMPARKQIGRRTIFNILGPLANPASATHQLIGVFEPALTRDLASVLMKLGSKSALVVCGDDGLDEISVSDSTVVSELRNGKISTYKIFPEDFNIKRVDLKYLQTSDIAGNKKVIMDVLGGSKSPCRDIVVLNSAAALFAAGTVGSIKSGMGLAAESIDSGRALRKLELLIEYSR